MGDFGRQREAAALDQVERNLSGSRGFGNDPINLREFIIADVMVDVDEVLPAGNLVGAGADPLPIGAVNGDDHIKRFGSGGGARNQFGAGQELELGRDIVIVPGFDGLAEVAKEQGEGELGADRVAVGTVMGQN